MEILRSRSGRDIRVVARDGGKRYCSGGKDDGQTAMCGVVKGITLVLQVDGVLS